MATDSSSSADLKLASAGDDVKIWQASDFSVCHRLTSRSADFFRSVHWSWDFRQIVSVPAPSHQVLLTLIKADVPHYLDLTMKEETSFAQFSNTSSSILGIGSRSGTVLIWNIKQMKSLKLFSTDKSETTSLQFNWNDSYLASGSQNGTITIHNCITGQSCAPFSSTVGHAIRSLQYSYCKKALIGCASDDGSITLWDANTRQVNHNFQAVHVAPATGLRFSPANPLLLVSVGLDKKMGCYDVQSKKVIKMMDCETPMTAVDFKTDGNTLAVGSTRGKILIYDMRFLMYPRHTLSAHTTSVHCLSFQDSLRGATARAKLTKRSDVCKSEISKMYLNSKNNVAETASHSVSTATNFNTKHSDLERYSLTNDIFSPIRETSQISPCQETSIALPEYSSNIFKNIEQNQKSPVSSKDSMLVFSPAEDQTVLSGGCNIFSGGSSPAFMEKISSCEKENVTSPTSVAATALIPEEKNTDMTTEKAASFLSTAAGSMKSPQNDYQRVNRWPTDKQVSSVKCMPDLSCLGLKGICSSNSANFAKDDDSLLKERIEFSEINNPLHPVQSVTMTPPSLEIKKSPNVDVNEIEKLKLGLSHESASDLIDEGRGTGAQTTPITPQSFQAEYVRQCVVDVMEDHFDEVRKMFHLQHVQMCRQLEKQQEEIESLFSKYSVDTDLLSEVVSLKKQNHFLKNLFR